MLKIVHQQLVDQGLINPSTVLNYSTRLAGNYSIVARAGAKLFHIKLSDTKNLENEFKNLRYLNTIIREFMPKAIAYFKQGALNGIISQGIDHVPLIANNGKLKDHIWQDLLRFFQLYPKLNLTSTTTKLNLNSIANRWSHQFSEKFFDQRAYCILESLPAIPQHCDFAINNLGIYKDTIVVFDWEDYAKIAVALFDFTIFICSINNFNISLTLKQLRNDHALNKLTKQLIASYNLNLEQYIQIIPLHLLIFLDLKQNFGYAQEAIVRTKSSVNQALELCWE